MVTLKPLILFESLLLLVLAFSSQTVAASKSHIEHPKYKHASTDYIKNKHIVKFSSSHTTGLSDTFLESFQKEYADVNIEVLQNYKSSVFHGLSFHIDAPDSQVYSNVLNAMMDHPDVENVHSQYKMYRSSVDFGQSGIDLAIDPTDIINPHHMTQVKRVHDELKNKGKGIFIGIIDSGIDYMHPALGGGFGKGYKVAAGYDLVGDNYNEDEGIKPIEDDDPSDNCPIPGDGHGTHVAGIIAGYDPIRNFSGVAPDATLGMWRIFSCASIGSSDDLILQALIRAYEAGVDIINLSLGSSASWSSSAVNTAVENIIAHGVVVVLSAGNSGDESMFTMSTPSIAQSAISVASIENDFFYGPSFKASGIDHFIPSSNLVFLTIAYSFAYGNTSHFPDQSIPMVIQTYHNIISNTAELCDKENIYFSENNIKGSLILVPYEPDCYLPIARIAKEKDALGLILIFRDDFHSGINSKLETNITSLIINADYGLELMKQYKAAGTVRIKLRNSQGKSYLNQNHVGGTISSFSSVGPTAELLFKPEIAGVGGAILSTVPIKYGGWTMHRGTSMSAPYVAGSIGLYLAAYGKNLKHNPMFIKEKFMNYAKPVQVYESSALDSPLRQGAGLIQVYDTITQTTHISPSKISFNDTATDLYKSHTLIIDNWGPDEVKYSLYNNVSVALVSFNASSNEVYSGPPDRVTKSVGVTFSTNDITIPSNKSVDVTITVDLSDPSLSSHFYYGGFIQFKSKNDRHRDMRVPYFGVYGHQKELPIFSPVEPLQLNDTVTDTLYKITDKKSFKFDTYGDKDIDLIFNIVTPTSFLKCELIDDQGKALGYIPIIPTWDIPHGNNTVHWYNLSRNSKDSPYYTIGVNSRYIPPEYVIDNTVVSKVRYQGIGRYRLSALKLFGNPEVIEDWEVHTSSPVEFI
ncbi:subtilisin-like protein [Backusella circina FSU 941]|nr:subtilisin-like protein [Backusella circina FSU 941]